MTNDEGAQKEGEKQGTDDRQSVSMSDYIGVKEMLRRKEELLTSTQQELVTTQSRMRELETKVSDLDERVKSMVDPTKVKDLEVERDQAKTELAQVRRTKILEGHNISPDDVKDLTDDQLQVYVEGLKKGKGQVAKPAPDLGSGMGSSPKLSGREMMKQGFERER